MQTALRCKSNN